MDKADNHIQTSGSRKGIAIAALIVLTLVAVWLVPHDEPKHADIPLPRAAPVMAPAKPAATAETQGTGPAPIPKPVQTQKPVQTPEPAPRQEPVREGVTGREFITMAEQSGASTETLYDQAEELRRSGMLADAHLLYFQAARQGHIGASMALAKQADPAFFSAGSSILDEPDMTQAVKWYLIAAEAGDKTAAVLLENLRAYIQTQAAAGDPKANRLLLQWR